jgi:hypothetical protein
MTQILNTFQDAAPSSRSIIYNSLGSSDLGVIAVSSPQRLDQLVAKRVDTFSNNIAVQINNQRLQYSPGMTCADLEDYIADIQIETSAQGAGVLTLSLIDPSWALLHRDPKTGTSFIDVDENGYLWPPIELTFPEEVSDSTWRLCGCQPSSDTTQANIQLIFEDAIVAELREHDQNTDPSCATSLPNETRAEFMERCVKTASKNKLIAGEVGIRFVSLLPKSAFTGADLTKGEQTAPKSAKVKDGHNKNWLKQPPGRTGLGASLGIGSGPQSGLPGQVGAGVASGSIGIGSGMTSTLASGVLAETLNSPITSRPSS